MLFREGEAVLITSDHWLNEDRNAVVIKMSGDNTKVYVQTVVLHRKVWVSFKDLERR